MFTKPERHIPLSWIFVFIGIVIVVIGIMVTSPSVPLSDPSSQEEIATEQEVLRLQGYQEMLVASGSAVYVIDQISGSSEVFVSEVIMAAPGYVAIFSDDDGVPGNQIGISDLLENEEHQLIITVDEVLSEGIYYAVVYQDDGDHVFTGSDSPLANDQGVVVMMSFSVVE